MLAIFLNIAMKAKISMVKWQMATGRQNLLMSGLGCPADQSSLNPLKLAHALSLFPMGPLNSCNTFIDLCQKTEATRQPINTRFT
jgi:hypothetical protein